MGLSELEQQEYDKLLERMVDPEDRGFYESIILENGTEEYELVERCKKEVEEAHSQHRQENLVFQEKLETMEKTLSRNKDINNLLQALNKDCKRERDALIVDAKKYNETVEKNIKLQSEIDDLSLAGDDNEERITELEKKILEQGGQYKDLETRLKTNNQDLSKVNTLLSECKTQKENTEKELEMAKRNIELYNTQTQKLTESMLNGFDVQRSKLIHAKDVCEKEKGKLIDEKRAKEILYAELENQLLEKDRVVFETKKLSEEYMNEKMKNEKVLLDSLKLQKVKANTCQDKLRNLIEAKDVCEKEKGNLYAQLEHELSKTKKLSEEYMNEKTKNENVLNLVEQELEKANKLNKEYQKQLIKLTKEGKIQEDNFKTRLNTIEVGFNEKLQECKKNSDKIELKYRRTIEENVNSNTTVKKYLGSPNTCHKTGWVVNPETGRCWKETNPGYIRRPRWTPDKDSPKFKSKRAKSKKWEINPNTGRYRKKKKDM